MLNYKGTKCSQSCIGATKERAATGWACSRQFLICKREAEYGVQM